MIIIGGGIVGCALAYEFGRKLPKETILVLERNETIPGVNQSSRNGGVIHSGIYYPKDVEPLKALLCIDGNDLLYSFCRHFNVPHQQTGKLILATTPQDEEYLKFFFSIGQANGISGLRMLSGKDAKQIEPNLSENVTMAIHVPTCGSVALDPFVDKLRTIADQYGVEFQTGTKVTAINKEANNFSLLTSSSDGEEAIECETLINAAGLYADEIAKMVNPQTTYEIEATRGELAGFSSGLRPDVAISGMHLFLHLFATTTTAKR